MISGAQIRAARAMLKWKAKDLAEASGISWATVQRMEAVDGVPPGLGQNIEKMQKALEKAGVVFIAEGVGSTEGGVGVRLKD